jgi:DNA-binding NarL/FixJ family response regulator
MANPVRILVVDDHWVVRAGVCALLEDAADIAVVGEAEDGARAVEEAQRLGPQVILMDLQLPSIDGVEAIRRILASQPEVGIVVLTGAGAEEEVLAAVEAGALGYLAKTSPKEEFLEAIRRVAHGEAWLPPRLARRLLAHLKPAPAVAKAAKALTGREQEVLGLLAQGRSNREIACRLGVAEITVRTHVSRILGKLGVSNRVEAALHALRAGLTPLEAS